MNLLGLFRRKSDGVGQKSPPLEGAGPYSSADRRLTPRAALDYELGLLMNDLAAVAEDIHAIAGRADHQRFTEYKIERDHYRCISQIRFHWRDCNGWPDAAFYLECPESKRLLPIVRAIPDRRCNGFGVVWVSDMADGPIVVRGDALMYVSDEPDVAGKTLDEVSSRYGKDIGDTDDRHATRHSTTLD